MIRELIRGGLFDGGAPALRVRGPYLAMVTIAFGFIVENFAVEMRGLTGGQNGLMNLPRPALPGLPGSERTVAIVAIVTAGVALMLFLVVILFRPEGLLGKAEERKV